MTFISPQAVSKVSAVHRKNNSDMNNSIYADYTKEQASPLSLELVQGEVSGFVIFYSVSLRRQCLLIVSKDKSKVIHCPLRQPSLITFSLHHGGLCHKAQQQDHLRKILARFPSVGQICPV